MRHLNQCVMTALVTILIGCVCVARSAYAQPTASDSITCKERLLTAFGQSELRVRPDLVELRLGVETEASTAAQAREENASRANKVVGAIKALGIPERQIQTSVYQIEPVRRFPPGQQPTAGLPPIVGYRVRNVVSVRTSNFDLIGKIIDDSVRAGANTVDGVQFMLQDDRYIRQRALQEAVAEARSNAQAMAKTLGLRLVAIHAVQQGAFGVVSPAGSYRALAAAETATPIMPGEITVNASATVTYVIR